MSAVRPGARFLAAVALAAQLHDGQLRKGTGVPYLAHPLGVASLAFEAGGDEDAAIAGLLHDTVEDQGGLPTLERIRAQFGERVAAIVLACSDSTAELLGELERTVADMQALAGGAARAKAESR
ncbi:MAG: HD domain-containing protein [Candidatus Limnocylindrales bacterium]